MTLRIVSVVQARSLSERLRGKVLAPLGGLPVIGHVLSAVRAASLIDDVILATTTNPADDELAAVGQDLGVRVFRGEEHDVLDRFVRALERDSADVVVRHGADSPLTDPDIINKVVGHYLKGGCDYASNVVERSWPRGAECEVFSRDALERSHREGQRPEDREHVTIYIRTHPEQFRLLNVKATAAETWPELRLTLDTPDDLRLLDAVFHALYVPDRQLRIGPVIDWLRAHPEVVALNAHVEQKRVLGRVF